MNSQRCDDVERNEERVQKKELRGGRRGAAQKNYGK
jgi:hypothetical protein